MQLATLCYIKKENKYLMLHRVKKLNDPNKGKWIGVGGKFEDGECPEDCLLREVKEETGLELTRFHFHGVITFVSDQWEDELMFLYTADQFTGTLNNDCREGELAWIPVQEIKNLNLWEGDRVFLDLMLKEVPYFNLKLVYQGDKLIQVMRDGKESISFIRM